MRVLILAIIKHVTNLYNTAKQCANCTRISRPINVTEQKASNKNMDVLFCEDSDFQSTRK